MSELIVFDFDFTIAKTIEHMWVWSPRGSFTYNNKTYRKVHPTQLQQSGILDDEEINNDSFQEFYNLNITKTQIIQPLLPYLVYYTSKQKIHILTARPQSIENDALRFLQNYQINTSNIQFTGLTNSYIEKKIEWINNQILTNNLNKLVLFEDNIKLINYMLENCIINKSLYYINNYTNKTVITHYE